MQPGPTLFIDAASGGVTVGGQKIEAPQPFSSSGLVRRDQKPYSATALMPADM
jgi:hypothetical protein